MKANNRMTGGSGFSHIISLPMHLQWFAAEGDGTGGGDGNGAADGTGNNGGGTGNNAPADGSPKLGWRAALKAELRDHELLRDKKDINEVSVALIDLNERMKRSVVLPGEKADEKELGEFFKKLGRPDSKDEYAFERKKLPEGMTYSDEFETWFKDSAHKAGLTKTQAAQLYALYNDQMEARFTKQSADQSAALAETEKILRQEWKDGYKVRLERARRVVSQLGGEELVSYLQETGLGNDIRLVKAMDRIAELVGEDTLVKGFGSKTKGKTGSDGWSFPNTPGME